MGSGATPGSILRAGVGLWLSLTMKLGDEPAGMTTGDMFPVFDGNWIINGPGTGPEDMIWDAGAGTDDRVVVIVEADDFSTGAIEVDDEVQEEEEG